MKLTPERDALPRLLAFVYAPMALAAWWLIEHRILVDLTRLFCPLLKHTGVACPTCGGTRAGLALGRLDPVAAWMENPLIAVGLLVLGGWFVYALIATPVKRLRVSVSLGPVEARVIRGLVFGLIIGTWIYEIRRHWV